MGKFKELDILLQDISSAAQLIISSTNELREMFSGTANDEEDEDNLTNTYNFEETEIYVKKEISLEYVRKVLADILISGKTAQVKELLNKYGANKLSEVDPSNYEALLKDAGDLNG